MIAILAEFLPGDTVNTEEMRRVMRAFKMEKYINFSFPSPFSVISVFKLS
jgi:hypothetical protein